MVRINKDVPLHVLILKHPYTHIKDTSDKYVLLWESLRISTSKKLQEDGIIYANNTQTRLRMCDFFLEEPNFLMLLIVELLMRNIYVCERNVVWYNGEKGADALHADITGYNAVKKKFYIINMCYESDNLVCAKKHTRKIVNFLGTLSNRPVDVIGFILPLYMYRKNHTIMLKNINII